MSEHKAATFLSTMHRLEAEEVLKNPLRVPPSTLPLESLKEAPEVFQPRDLTRDTASKEQHVRTLVSAIYSEPNNRLDPITVWWSGKSWYVIDGHHRKQAYEHVQQLGKVQIDSVPVCEFQGSLIEAICEATTRNSKDKLAMTQDDKSNRAWLLVAMGKSLSKRQVATVCKISVPTVSRMRKRLQEIREAYPEGWQEEVTTMTWQEAQKFGKETTIYNEDWEDGLAKEWAKRLAETFGNKPVRQPEIFWKAVEAYSPVLAEQLTTFLAPVSDEFLEGESDF